MAGLSGVGRILESVSIPPDDLPRSPSGRIPEWVWRDAAGNPLPDTTWRAPTYAPYPPPRRRRRRGRGLAVFLVLLLGMGAVWWSQSADPRGDLVALTDPTTYTDLADRAGETIDDVLARRNPLDPVAVPLPDAGPRTAPPIGVDEEAKRLAPAVTVSDPDPAHAFAAVQDDGVTAVGWSPCRPVHYVVNEAGAPSGFADTVQAEMAALGAATGLVFTFAGTTAEAPSEQRAAYLPEQYGERWAPVLIAVSDEAGVPYLGGDTAGVTYTYRARGVRDGLWFLTSGAVYLDGADFTFIGGPGPEPGWIAVLRHELGHLAGLDHLDDPSQLMNPVTSNVSTFQDGDLTGLAILGQGACAPDV